MAEKIIETRIVLKNDISTNWSTNNPVLLKGEVGIATDLNKFKIGDGTTAWNSLPYATLNATEIQTLIANNKSAIYQGTKTSSSQTDNDAITAALAGATPKKDDICIIKTKIETSGDSEHYEYKAFVYNGTDWAAMDGNYSAENVYFPDDLLTTCAIGNITLNNGQATIDVAGQNLVDAWQTIFVKEDNTGLKTGSPTANVTGASTKYVQVGSSSSQTITVSLNEDGSYKYGFTTESGTEGQTATTITNDGTTGVVVDTSKTAPYEMTYTVSGGSATSLTASESNAAQFVVNSGVQTAKKSASITAKVYYTDGNTPVSNLKKMYPSQKIAAGNATKTSEVFRWYVPMYQGFKYNADLIADPANITADQVKGLTEIKDATAYNQTKPTSAAATASWRQYFVAVPASYNATLKSAKDSNNLTLTVSTASNVTLTLGTASIEYKVFYINNAADYDTKNISLTW